MSGIRSEDDKKLDEIFNKTMGQDLHEKMSKAAGAQPAKTEPAAGKQNLPVVKPAQDNAPAIKKDFMQRIGGDTPEELAISLGGKKYATKTGRWYALHASGRQVRSSKIEILQTPYEKGPGLKFKEGTAVIKSIIVLENGKPEGQTFEALGEASPENTSSMIFNDDPTKKDKYGKPLPIVNNLLHVAETKAKNRCVGDITAGGWFMGIVNEGLVEGLKHVESCSAEELPEPPKEVVDAEFSTEG